MTDGVAQRRVAGTEGCRCNLSTPRERRAARLRRRTDERAASHVSAQKTARLEFPIRADDRGAADSEALGKLALGRQTRSRRKLSARDGAFEKVHEVPVKRARGPHELTLDLLKHRPSRTVAV